MGFVHYIYSRRFGWAPLRFLIRGRDFYEERGRGPRDEATVLCAIIQLMQHTQNEGDPANRSRRPLRRGSWPKSGSPAFSVDTLMSLNATPSRAKFRLGGRETRA